MDLQFNYQVPGYKAIDQGPLLTFGILNVGDEDPPAVNTEPGYDVKVHDPRGRMLYARFIQQF